MTGMKTFFMGGEKLIRESNCHLCELIQLITDAERICILTFL